MATAVEMARAQLAVAELEEQLVSEKPDASTETKLALREARRRFREMREAEGAADGVARPGPVSRERGTP